MQEENISEKPAPRIVAVDRPAAEVLRDFFNAAQADENDKDSIRPMDIKEAKETLEKNRNIEIHRGRIISIDFSDSDEKGATIDIGVYAAFNGPDAVEAALRSLKENYWEEL